MLGQFYPGQQYPGQVTADYYPYSPDVTTSGEPFGPYNEVAYNDVVIYVLQPSLTTATYYFNASDAGPTDASATWTNDANAFDGSTSTFASTSDDFTTLKATGTNAPITGTAISDVRMRIYWRPTTDPSPRWSSYLGLGIPTGGWTWQKVNDLEVRTNYSDGLIGIAAVQIATTIYSGSDLLGTLFDVGETLNSGSIEWYRSEVEVTYEGTTVTLRPIDFMAFF